MSLNMKRKRRNSQIVNSSIQTRSKTRKLATATATHLDFYLPDECWEHAFKILISGSDKRACLCLKSISAVSKQLLSITNRLRLSLTINTQEHPFLPRLLCRFTNLNSLNLTCSASNLNKLLLQLSRFPSNLTTLVLSLQRGMFPADWLQTFHRKKITTLTSLICSNFTSLDTSYLVLIAYSFPNLQLLDLKDCRYISEEGVAHVLRRCCNITRLDLSGCSGVMLHGMNFEVPKLKVLDLSHTLVDDKNTLCTLRELPWAFRTIIEKLLSCHKEGSEACGKILHN